MRTIVFALAATMLSAPAHAATESLQFLICQPGGPELQEKEQTVIRDFYRYFGKKLAMKEGAITGNYFNRRAKCIEALDENPSIVMLSLDLYIERADDLKLLPIAQIDADGTTSKYYLMSGLEGPSTLAQVRGKPIAGTHLSNPKFVARVVFDGKLGTPNELVLKPQNLGLRAVRNVIRGRAAAVLLDAQQYRAIDGTPFQKKLKLVYESEPLPNAPVAVSSTRIDAKLAGELSKLLTTMNTDPNGQALVKTFGIKGFVKPAPKTWDGVKAVMAGR